MEKNELICTHIPLAECLAKKKKRSVTKRIYYDELKSAAYKGLVDAANRYDANKGEFKSFASRRILGEMEDYLRELQWGTRNNRIFVCELQDRHEKDRQSSDILLFVPSKVRDIFTWYYLDGLTMKEIGARIGLTESSVSKLLKKYREELRRKVNFG